MKRFLSLFSNMKLIDWILAIAFIALISYAVYLVFPPKGWMIGIVAAVLLLVLAKHRRDRLTQENQKNKKK